MGTTILSFSDRVVIETLPQTGNAENAALSNII